MNEPSAAMPPPDAHLQQRALQLYLALRLHRDTWAGALMLGIGLDEAGRALALASLAAGAAALFLEHDSAHLRSAQREGCCTFTVTTLPEAIRILKNEVRQRRAITVALRGPIGDALQEAVRRGLQPEALAFSRPPTAQEEAYAASLHARGADQLSGFGLVDSPDAIDLQAPLFSAMGDRWVLDTHAATRAERIRQDVELLTEANTVDGDADPLERLAARWLQAAPSLFPRARSRAMLCRTV